MAIETAVRVAAFVSMILAIGLCAASSIFVHRLLEIGNQEDPVQKDVLNYAYSFLGGRELIKTWNQNRTKYPPALAKLYPTVKCLCDKTLNSMLLKFIILNAVAIVCAVGQVVVSVICGFKIYRQNCRKLGTIWMFSTMLTCTVLSIIFFLTFTYSTWNCVQTLFNVQWSGFAALVAVNMFFLLLFIIIVFCHLYKDQLHYHPQPPFDLDDDNLLIDRMSTARTGHRVIQNSNLYQ